MEKISGRWTDKEKYAFEAGLEKYGRGNWRLFLPLIPTKTQLQVRQHAYAYFKKKRLKAERLLRKRDHISSSESSSGSESESDSDSEDEEEGDSEDYEDLIDIVSKFLWKKSVRHEDGDPYYSFDESYLRSTISDYLYDYDYSSYDHEELEIVLDDEEYSYGGYYYTLGKKNSKPLFSFYEKHGFVEDPKVNIVWQCFTSTPYPAMILDLKK